MYEMYIEHSVNINIENYKLKIIQNKGLNFLSWPPSWEGKDLEQIYIGDPWLNINTNRLKIIQNILRSVQLSVF